MLTAGCDVGSRTAKAVILEDNTILTDAVISAKLDPIDSAQSVMDMALEQVGLALDEIHNIVGTGFKGH